MRIFNIVVLLGVPLCGVAWGFYRLFVLLTNPEEAAKAKRTPEADALKARDQFAKAILASWIWLAVVNFIVFALTE